MTDPTEIIANHTINWAAHLLVDHHGAHAPILAARCAAEEKQAGNDDLASIWDTVREATSQLIGAAPVPAGATIH